MRERHRQIRPNIPGRAHRGQALFVALIVLFVMLFIGGLFVARVARNLAVAGRSRDNQDSLYLAEAGIQYCDDALTNSPEGADWRPEPDVAKGPVPQTDPDYFWLNQGFARINRKGGRFLIRVIYDPRADDPRSQYLKIESIGRVGEVGNSGPIDPTVFVQNGSVRQRVERIAYKQIGLTDYLRFITNIDRRTSENFLGTPAFGKQVAAVFGDPSTALPDTVNGRRGDQLIINGGLRVNGDVRLGGDVNFYLSNRGNDDPALSPEGIHVSGNILVAPNRNTSELNVTVNQLINVAPGPNQANLVRPTGDPNFTTILGKVRDGSTLGDTAGYARRIPYLEPPVVDGYAAGTGTLRYRVVTRDSGKFVTANANTGQNGFGTGIYINNLSDRQQETATPGLAGSYSLRAEWLNPKAGFAQGHWDGPFYRPPGVRVLLMGNFIRLIRNDGRIFNYPDGTPVTQQGGKVLDIPLSDFDRLNYRIPDGTPTGRPFPLPPLPHDGDNAQADPNNPPGYTNPFGDKDSYGVNVVVMAEGNALVSGVYGTPTDPNAGPESTNPDANPVVRKMSRVHLTIVSGGTAYIEGNVLKGDPDRASTCAILARDYVCVNTTMFLSPENQTGVWSPYSGDNALDAFNTSVGLSRPTYDTKVSFGLNPNLYTSSNLPSGLTEYPIYLMLRHAAMAPGPALVSLLINPGLPNGTFYPFNVAGAPAWIYPVGLKPGPGGLFLDSVGIPPQFETRAFPLNSVAGAFNLTPGADNYFRFQLDQAGADSPLGSYGSTDYLLGGAMVAPLDIRIEALLYAQQRSFFVLPGYGMNPDPNDTRANYLVRLQQEQGQGILPTSPNSRLRPSFSSFDTPEERRQKSAYPFYGEPTAARITVYGAVAENYTAAMGDQAQWMKQWGYFPAILGSSDVPVPDLHLRVQDPANYSPATDTTQDFRTPYESNPADGVPITRGLRFVYDPAFALPYLNPTSADMSGRNTRRLRFLTRGVGVNGAQVVTQTLPPIPRLPVCPDRLYFGDADRIITQ